MKNKNLPIFLVALALIGGTALGMNHYFYLANGASDYFIWCGAKRGQGELVLQILNGTNLLAETSAWIQLKDIKEMYERYTVGDNPAIAPTNTARLAGEDLPPGVTVFKYDAPTDPNTPYILHVHGFNMERWEKDRFAETEFKRLYWQGYRGRFGSFRWPTTTSYYAKTFDDSEYNAWSSARGLLNLLGILNAEYPGKVYLTAHSHGNVVAGEALRLAGTNQVVNTYIAMQGAVPSHAYDPTTPVRLLNTGGVNHDDGTPDRYAEYYTNGAPCYFSGSVGAGTYVNFYNTNDWALVNLWRPDQDLKPDNGYGYDAPNFYQGSLFEIRLSFPSDTYAIFSYCDEARCQALGAQGNVGGAFSISKQVDLEQLPYSFGDKHKYHSGEFRSDYANRWQFWNQVLIQTKLK